MTEFETPTSPEISPFILDLTRAAKATADDLEKAASLEKQAALLKATAAVWIDRSIERASGRLIELSDAGHNGRDLLEGVLHVNQFKPFNVFYGQPPDINETLGAYDQLKAGTPFVSPQSSKENISSGVISDRPVTVTVSNGLGMMGPLPQANITFGFRAISDQDKTKQKLQEEEQIITQDHSNYVKNAIGEQAIQKLVDRQEYTPNNSSWAKETKRRELAIFAQAISGLILVTNVSLDLSKLESTLLNAQHDDKRATQIKSQNWQARRSKLHPLP